MFYILGALAATIAIELACLGFLMMPQHTQKH